jgi:hypothetical protein
MQKIAVVDQFLVTLASNKSPSPIFSLSYKTTSARESSKVFPCCAAARLLRKE